MLFILLGINFLSKFVKCKANKNTAVTTMKEITFLKVETYCRKHEIKYANYGRT